VSAFSLAHGPGIEPCVGGGGVPAQQGVCYSLSLCPAPPLILSLSQINKIFKKYVETNENGYTIVLESLGYRKFIAIQVHPKKQKNISNLTISDLTLHFKELEKEQSLRLVGGRNNKDQFGNK